MQFFERWLSAMPLAKSRVRGPSLQRTTWYVDRPIKSVRRRRSKRNYKELRRKQMLQLGRMFRSALIACAALLFSALPNSTHAQEPQPALNNIKSKGEMRVGWATFY